MNWYWWVTIGVVVAAASGVAIWWALDEEESVAMEPAANEEEDNETKGEGAQTATREESDSVKLIGPELFDLEKRTVLAKIEDEGVILEKDGGLTYFSVESNASTGYSWIIDESACSEDILTVEESYAPPEPEMIVDGKAVEMAGAPGTSYFTFTGGDKGDCTFKMAYARSWEFNWEETNDNFARMITIPVTIA